MWCTVYRLMQDNKMLPVESAKATAKHGWLIYRTKSKIGAPYQHAILLCERFDTGPDPLLELRHANLTLCDGGLRLRGFEWVATGSSPHQAWWVVPTPGPVR